MMYHEWIKPGKYPRIQSKILIKESDEQMPLLIHTGSGGKRTERITRQMSDMHSQQQQHMVDNILGYSIK